MRVCRGLLVSDQLHRCAHDFVWPSRLRPAHAPRGCSPRKRAPSCPTIRSCTAPPSPLPWASQRPQRPPPRAAPLPAPSDSRCPDVPQRRVHLCPRKDAPGANSRERDAQHGQSRAGVAQGCSDLRIRAPLGRPGAMRAAQPEGPGRPGCTSAGINPAAQSAARLRASTACTSTQACRVGGRPSVWHPCRVGGKRGARSRTWRGLQHNPSA